MTALYLQFWSAIVSKVTRETNVKERQLDLPRVTKAER